ncbi:MAG: DUF1559 domain-containing protein [Phycisphaerales bacterium]|nr:DUF1559 domain-containing protein [Phycisphaerales bacterium]
MPDRTRPADAPARAFTLIELLVVIAIIALLLAILLPGLAGARNSARAAVCLSNQRQIGLALMMYANANKEYIPREAGTSETWGPPPYNPGWPFVLRPFLDENARSDVPDAGLKDRYTRAKYYHDPARPRDEHNIHYVNNGMRFRAPGVLAGAKPPHKLNSIPFPHDTLYLACFANDPTGIISRTIYSPSNTEEEIGIYYDTLRPSHIAGTTGVGSYLTAQRIEPKRHGNGANATFLDGHSARQKASVLTDLKRWDDQDYTRS